MVQDKRLADKRFTTIGSRQKFMTKGSQMRGWNRSWIVEKLLLHI